MATRVVIHGAAGRMGKRLVALAADSPRLELVAAVDAPECRILGSDAGTVAGVGELGISVTSDWSAETDCVVDFSIPTASLRVVRRCVKQRLPLVLATTGFDTQQEEEIREAGKTIPLCWAPSMSLTVNLAMKLVQIAASALKDHPSGADVEIIERHHRYKEDSPSGTALAFGRIVQAAMGQFEQVHGRSGRPGPRPHDEIGYHAVRVGDNPGEHTIILGLLGETLEIRVAASNRDCYAHGALLAAEWLKEKRVGLYDMQDVLGLNEVPPRG